MRGNDKTTLSLEYGMEINVPCSMKAFKWIVFCIQASHSILYFPVSISESQSIAMQEKSISSNNNLLYLFKFAWINSFLKYESIFLKCLVTKIIYFLGISPNLLQSTKFDNPVLSSKVSCFLMEMVDNETLPE